MNILKGKISDIKLSGNLSLVSVVVHGITFKSIIIETPETASYLKKDHEIQLLFKETEVIIGKDEKPQISMQNKMLAKIIQVKKGELLSKIVLQTKAGIISSIITTNATKELRLEPNDDVIAMVKTNEIMLQT